MIQLLPASTEMLQTGHLPSESLRLSIQARGHELGAMSDTAGIWPRQDIRGTIASFRKVAAASLVVSSLQ